MSPTRTADGYCDPQAAPAPPWTIGFLSLGLNGYFFGSLLGGVAEAAHRAGCRVVAIQTHDSGQSLDTIAEDPFRTPVAWDRLDAFIVVVNAVPDQYLRALYATGKPLVLIAQEAPGFSCPVVVPDNAAGIAAIVEHLAAHGHSRIAFLDRIPDASDDRLRLAAYQAEMTTRGFPVYRPAVVSWTGEGASAAEAAQQLLSEDPPPTAVVASTDVTATMLIEALRARGIEVPRDMAVIGFDDIDDAATQQPPLSTVAQSFPISGSTAVQLALRALAGEPVEPGYHYVPVSFVARESCGCPGPRPDAGVSAPGSPANRFSSDLIAAVYQGDQMVERSPEDTGPAGAGPAGLAQRRLRELSELAGDIVGLLERALHDPDAEVGAAVEAIGATIHRLVPHDRRVLRIADLIRQYARSLSGQFGAADVDTLARMEDLAYRLSIRAIERNMSSRPAEYLYFQQQRNHYEYSIALLRRRSLESRSLAWLSRTPARSACLALWGGDSLEGTDPDHLIVTDSYNEVEDASREVTGQACTPSSFPPAPIFAAIDQRPGDILYVLPVRFEGSDWGLLALVGPLELREQASLEMVNYWSVLLCVALDQRRAVQSLISQREHLAEAYGRERILREEIRVSEERYALAAEAANDGLWDWNLADGSAYFSPRWKALLGHSDEAIGAAPQEWWDRIHPEDRHNLEQAVARQYGGDARTMEIEYRMRTADGSYRWMLTRARSVHGATGQLVRLVGSMTDINDRKCLEQQLRHDARYDTLTGLPNRTLLLERLNRAIELAERRPGYRFAVVFLDLNGFKVINDSLGHEAGDQLLVHVAEQLTTQMRTGDTVSRFGGDEFVVLLEDVVGVAHVNAVIDRLLAALATPLELATRTVVVSASAGIAANFTTAANCTAEAFIRDADTAMYRAKTAGGATAVLFDESMHTGAVARLQLEIDLHTALAEGECELYYQPIFTLPEQRLVGLEALIRWRHPSRGWITPDEFLPVAESTGLVLRLGQWTIAEACRQLRTWHDAFPDRRDITLSINLSHRQFWDPGLRPYVHRTLAEYGLSPTALVFEVTEGVMMHNPEAATALMRRLHDDTFKIHLDDFGTGHSSLAALHAFPIDALKIDRAFVSRVTAESRSRELVQIMVAMGRNLGVDVIAEGIETEEQAAALLEIGCPQVQGYLYSRPVPTIEVPGLLRGHRPAAVS